MVLQLFQRFGCCSCGIGSDKDLTTNKAEAIIVGAPNGNAVSVKNTVGIQVNGISVNGTINSSQDGWKSLNGTIGSGTLNDSNPSINISLEDIGDNSCPAYKVIVRAEQHEWFVLRRYAEFEVLFDIINTKVPNHGLKLPDKTSLDENTAEQDRDSLDTFIQEMMLNNELTQLAEVREFLQLDRWASTEDLNDSHSGESNCSCNSHTNPDTMLYLGPTENKQMKPKDFEFLRVIGKGSFGKVLLAKHRAEKKYYAVKVLSKNQVIKRNEAKHIMSERNVLLKNLTHPFLVGLQYSFQTPTKLYFVLDYVNGGELFFHLQRERLFAEPRARFYSAEICAALGYLHAQGIIYRDLKPENLLLDAQGHIVLTDFGLSKEGLYYNERTQTFCGTPEYLAPEVLRKESYDYTVDWWCFGCVLYEMLYGLPPFYSRNTSEMYQRILHKPLKLKASVSEDARDILSKLLQKDPKKRLGAGLSGDDEVKHHVFFSPIDWGDLMAKRVEPPFNPNVVDALDFHNIDPDFIQAAVPQSVGFSNQSNNMLTASVRQADDEFEGFSYAPPMTMT